MSTRTIIEINHDFLTDLANRPSAIQSWLESLRSAMPLPNPAGITMLGDRHHSEPLVMIIGGRKVEA